MVFPILKALFAAVFFLLWGEAGSGAREAHCRTGTRCCGREKSPVAVFEFGVNPVASLAVDLLASSGEFSLEGVFGVSQ